ncbi:hypothetical protein EB796_000123 [Bugula neritina]|uniref:Uncharacterized protein n=1 Tax=Bugula neritina TaxID=10212 RepID=A0A7J7KTN4_BUGNE|nr:hypothetical protein EB796_000123 [Bugula neritina]
MLHGCLLCCQAPPLALHATHQAPCLWRQTGSNMRLYQAVIDARGLLSADSAPKHHVMLNFHKLVYQTIQYLNYFDQLSLSAVQMNVWSLEQPSAVHLTAINKLKMYLAPPPALVAHSVSRVSQSVPWLQDSERAVNLQTWLYHRAGCFKSCSARLDKYAAPACLSGSVDCG